MKLEINHRGKNCRKYKHVVTKQYFFVTITFCNQCITEEIKEKIKKYLETNGKYDDPKPMGHGKSVLKGNFIAK